MRVLGIETSCDETAIAIYDGTAGLMAHVIHSQTDTHAPYGGVVPELASRDHVSKILSILEEVLKKANIPLDSIDGIAYTAGPGLIGALMVGACQAKALGYALQVPTIPIHHMEGHLLAALIDDANDEDAENIKNKPPEFPFLALLVSGGHTLLVEVEEIGQYTILGESLDDAAGEAFDKTAKLLGLGYPGGPLVSELAKKGKKGRFQFPRPLTDRPGLDFSFSGLKTFTMNTLKNTEETVEDKQDVAFAFQEALVDTLFIKCKRAIKQTGHRQLVIAGGVSANQHLREKFSEFTKEGIKLFYPKLEFCTDNGAMIAFAGFQRLKNRQLKNVDEMKLERNALEIMVQARWPMDTLSK